YNIHDNLEKRHEFRIQTIDDDDSLNDDEKLEAIRILNKRNDYDKIISEKNLSNWKSGNNDIDNLIQKCQSETIGPNKVIEWIPYENLANIEYLTKGGISEIYSADWIDGHYNEWDSKEQKLKRNGNEKVIVKRLENVKNANRDWFEEAKSHLTISNKWADLRNYLQKYHNQLIWKKIVKIVVDIIDTLLRIHNEKAIHRDLHSGNILYLQDYDCWYISDFGFCGPADKPLGSIYGNLPYIAPEVMNGKEYTFASDIYSIGMLMWEISSGQPPFSNYENDYDLVFKIINGMRPKVVKGTPLEYKNLMVQCWNADPLKRPDINTLYDIIIKLNKSILNESNDNKKSKDVQYLTVPSTLQPGLKTSLKTNNDVTSRVFTSKVYQFENLPEPKDVEE
ncbi:kinase-like domain-containing protein, partial [Glomus cerebriforme]